MVLQDLLDQKVLLDTKDPLDLLDYPDSEGFLDLKDLREEGEILDFLAQKVVWENREKEDLRV